MFCMEKIDNAVVYREHVTLHKMHLELKSLSGSELNRYLMGLV